MITYCQIKTGGGHWARVWTTLRFVAERAGAKWPAAHLRRPLSISLGVMTPLATGLHVYNSRFMSVLYSKKVADEYPWTQAVPDDPHSVSPIPSNDAQSTPKNTPQKRII